MISRDYFKNWNYKKHAKFCAAVYLALFAFDMTVSYPIVKTILDRTDEKEAAEAEEAYAAAATKSNALAAGVEELGEEYY